MIKEWTRVTTVPSSNLPDIETYVREYHGKWLSVQIREGEYRAFVGVYLVGSRKTVDAAKRLAERTAAKET